MTSQQVDVAVFTGSQSDLPTLQPLIDTFKEMEVGFEVRICSAHRTPVYTRSLVEEYEKRSVKLFICAAGFAAHLAGVVAAETVKPVIGIPIPSSTLQGMDSLLATVQMPGGIPVATMCIGKSGALNAALFAVQVLALQKPELTEKLLRKRKENAEKIENTRVDI